MISRRRPDLATAARARAPPGFISKDWPAADIAGAVRMVGLGMTVFRPQEAPAGPPLTDREREVLDLVGSGATNREFGSSRKCTFCRYDSCHGDLFAC